MQVTLRELVSQQTRATSFGMPGQEALNQPLKWPRVHLASLLALVHFLLFVPSQSGNLGIWESGNGSRSVVSNATVVPDPFRNEEPAPLSLSSGTRVNR